MVKLPQPKAESNMLDSSDKYLTLINTFVVDPEQAEKLMTVLSKATEEKMRHISGFVSASLHISGDRRHVANYTRWKSQDTYSAMFRDPEAQLHMREAAAIAKSYEPIFYELRETHFPD